MSRQRTQLQPKPGPPLRPRAFYRTRLGRIAILTGSGAGVVLALLAAFAWPVPDKARVMAVRPDVAEPPALPPVARPLPVAEPVEPVAAPPLETGAGDTSDTVTVPVSTATVPASPARDEAELAPPPGLVPIPVKPRNRISEFKLWHQLSQVPEVTIGYQQPTYYRGQVYDPPKHFKWTGPPVQLTHTLVKQRPDLAGLPVRMGEDCKLDENAAKNMQQLSRQLRGALAGNLRINRLQRHQAIIKELASPEFLKPHAVPCLMQMLAVEELPIRELLVEQLAGIKGKAASEGLAKLALFDLADDIRAQAIQALSQRPLEEYRAVLLTGFRHPWAPAADHAAEALVALQDRAALPALYRMVDDGDPTAPIHDPQDGPSVRELVRVNHLRNCTLCHAPSTDRNDLVRGRVPDPGSPLPPPIQYYDDSSDGPFVRADTTYLRQDFSVMQPVNKAEHWPSTQRFDFVVRQRPLSPRESADLLYPTPTASSSSPQREAMLYAIRELTADRTTSER